MTKYIVFSTPVSMIFIKTLTATHDTPSELYKYLTAFKTFDSKFSFLCRIKGCLSFVNPKTFV